MNRIFINKRINQLDEYIQVLTIGKQYMKSNKKNNKVLEAIILKVCQKTFETSLELIIDTCHYFHQNEMFEISYFFTELTGHSSIIKGREKNLFLKNLSKEKKEEVFFIKLKEREFYQELDNFIKDVKDFENYVRKYIA